jgi:hypothetical protein
LSVEYYREIPTDLEGNLRWRRRVLRAAEGDGAVQAALLHACERDVFFYINTFVWQFNPRKRGVHRVEPWICWDYQYDAVRAMLESIESGTDLVCQKSKEMGITWLFLIVSDYCALFQSNFQALFVSKTADAVDDPSPNSLFWKLDFMHERLPGWLRGRITRRKMYVGYEKTGSVVTGEAATGRAGVGGRATIVFVDEFPLIREGHLIRQRTSDTASTRFFNGTHLGTDTEFYQLTHNTPEIRKLTVHWSQHPVKRAGLYRSFPGGYEILDTKYNFPPDYEFVTTGSPTGGPFPGIRSPWYDLECVRKGTPRAVAMDLDIDPRGSSVKFFNEVLVQAAKDRCRDPVWEGYLFVDSSTGRAIRLIQADGGPLRLWKMPENGRMPYGRYGMGVDVALGTGSTNSCAAVMDADSGLVVAEYADPNIEPREFAEFCAALGRLCCTADGRPALMCWEKQGAGSKFYERLGDVGYENCYYEQNRNPLSYKMERSSEPGWNPTQQGIVGLLADFQRGLATGEVVSLSELTLDETLNFRWTQQGTVENANQRSVNDPSGARLNHADRVIAAALAYKTCLSMGLTKKPERKVERAASIMTLEGRRALAAVPSRDRWES